MRLKDFTYNGAVGINEELEISQAFSSSTLGIGDENWDETTRIALADYMIGLWEKYKIKVRAGTHEATIIGTSNAQV